MARMTNEELAARRRANDTKALVKQPQMQRWLLRFFEKCGIFTTTYRDNPVASAYAEGRRSLGLELLAELASECGDEVDVTRLVFRDNLALQMAIGNIRPPTSENEDVRPEPDPEPSEQQQLDRDFEPFER
jgi:hypothetical protein